MSKTPTSYQEPGGRWVHHFRQSFINDFRHCPEQARQKSQGLVPDSTSDSALVGTLAHHAIELFLLDSLEPECAIVAIDDMSLELWPEDLEPTHVPDRETGVDWARDCFDRWHQYVWPIVQNAQWEREDIEWQFEFLVYEDEERAIYIQGTADLAGREIFDWKTGTRDYGYPKEDRLSIVRNAKWQHQRYDAQPSMYALAKSLQLLEGGEPLTWDDQLELPLFHYARTPRDWHPGNAPMPAELVTITRTVADAKALILEMQHIATLIEARLPHWPLNPVEWWCSSSWCPVNEAGKCRGAYGLHYPSKNTLKGKGKK